jgi:predicted DNA-binding protein
MSDLVERLRSHSEYVGTENAVLLREAAECIEELERKHMIAVLALTKAEAQIAQNSPLATQEGSK